MMSKALDNSQNSRQYINLVLSSSSSLPARVIKFVSKNRLNHSSITLEPSLHEMYSFGRLVMWNAFYAGLVQEDRDKGFYKKFADTYIKLYRLPVSNEIYDKTKEYLYDAYTNKDSYKYNFWGVLLMSFGISIVREKQYFCSEFVATVVKECGIRPVLRNVHTYRPHYFEELDNIELVYEGALSKYPCENQSEKQKDNNKYVKEEMAG